QALDRLAQLFGDGALDVGERKRANVVLQAPELGDDVGGNHIRAGREKLPELDEGRPQLVEHLAQMTASRRPLAVLVVPAAFERVAEAVANRDLRDLAQPAEVA